jgi:DNA repair protein RecO (recombination protein O)
MRYTQPAICLRCIDYSETSQVVTFLTRDEGVVRLIAKGSKRAKSKSGGAIDLLSEGQLVYSHRGEGLGTLMEFTESQSHTALRADAGRLNAALYMIELVGEMLAEADPHPEVFALLSNALGRLARPEAPVAAVLAYFQWRLLRHAGLLGGLDACILCGRAVTQLDRAARREVYFSSRQGGLLCPACEGAQGEKFRLQPSTLSALAALAAAESGQKVTLPDDQARAVNRLLAYHIAHQLGKPLRMVRYVIPRRGKDERFSAG